MVMDSNIASLLRDRFPRALVRQDLGPVDSEVGHVIDVFGLAPSELPLLREFVRAVVRPLCRGEGRASPVVLGHSVEETREYYPDEFAAWWFRRWATSGEVTAVAGRGARWLATEGWTVDRSTTLTRGSPLSNPNLATAA